MRFRREAGSGGILDANGRPLLDMANLSSAQKGLFGTHTVRQIVPDGIKIGRTPGLGINGIDDIFRVNRPGVDYVVIEYKFVGNHGRPGSSGLGHTTDGRQGSLGWVTGSRRLEAAVGSEAVAQSIRRSVDAGRTETWVVTTRPNGSTEIQVLDGFGRARVVDASRILPPTPNRTGAQP